jgi:hypothetical protein
MQQQEPGVPGRMVPTSRREVGLPFQAALAHLEESGLARLAHLRPGPVGGSRHRAACRRGRPSSSEPVRPDLPRLDHQHAGAVERTWRSWVSPDRPTFGREQLEVSHAAQPAGEGGHRRWSRYGRTSPDRTADLQGLPGAPRRRVVEARALPASTTAGRSFADVGAIEGMG